MYVRTIHACLFCTALLHYRLPCCLVPSRCSWSWLVCCSPAYCKYISVFINHSCQRGRVCVFATDLICYLFLAQTRATAIIFDITGAGIIMCGFVCASLWPSSQCRMMISWQGRGHCAGRCYHREDYVYGAKDTTADLKFFCYVCCRRKKGLL